MEVGMVTVVKKKELFKGKDGLGYPATVVISVDPLRLSSCDGAQLWDDLQEKDLNFLCQALPEIVQQSINSHLPLSERPIGRLGVLNYRHFECEKVIVTKDFPKYWRERFLGRPVEIFTFFNGSKYIAEARQHWLMPYEAPSAKPVYNLKDYDLTDDYALVQVNPEIAVDISFDPIRHGNIYKRDDSGWFYTSSKAAGKEIDRVIQDKENGVVCDGAKGQFWLKEAWNRA